MKKGTLEAKLIECGDPKDAYYTVRLKEMIFTDKVSRIPDDYLKLLNDEESALSVRFAAFYCLFTAYRRLEQRYNLISLVDQYTKLFTRSEYNYLVEIIWSQYYKVKFMETPNDDLYAKALEHNRNAIMAYNNRLSENIGCYNNFADIVLDALAYENVVSENEIDEAMQYVNQAIYIQEKERGKAPYAEYYCSKARLLSYRKDYKEAQKMIACAISYETTEEKDSMVRISYYHNVQLQIKTNEAIEILDHNMRKFEEKNARIRALMEEQQGRYIEILGFFASAIALLVGTVSITLNIQSYAASAGLIISLSGTLIMSYTVLNLLFSKDIKTGRIFFSCLLSGITWLLGYCIGNQII